MTNADLIAKLLELPPDAKVITSVQEAQTVSLTVNDSTGPTIKYSKKHNMIIIRPRTIDL
jgi:hypothetical protein